MTTTELTITKISDLFGPGAAREARSAAETNADMDALLAFGDALMAATDREYVQIASSAVWDAANSSRFQPPSYDVECKASMCFAESERRHQAAGHTEDCRGAALYPRAWNMAVRDAGHSHMVGDRPACTCGHDSGGAVPAV